MRKNNSGFALIWVLLFAMFLLFSILFLLSGSEIETRSVEKIFAKNIARNNSIFALKTAMFDLQKAVGKDNVATTKFENVKTLTNNISSFVRPYDIAVIDMVPDPDGIHFTKTFNTVLSSNIVSVAEFDSINLFADLDRDVEAHILSINDESANCFGRYAYFIDDESQKNDLSIQNLRGNDLSKSDNFINKTCYQFSCLEMTDSLAHYKNFLEYFQKLDQIDQLLYLKKNLNLNELSANFTLNSYGVLSDSTNKKLKNDMSDLFLNSKHHMLQEKIFDTNLPDEIYSPRFAILSSFANHNAAEVVAPDNVLRPQIDNEIPNYYSKYLTSPLVHGFHPVIVGFSFSAKLISNNGEICIKYFPKIAMWNPYNTDFNEKNFFVTFNCRNDHTNLKCLLSNAAGNSSIVLNDDVVVVDNRDLLKFSFKKSLDKGEIALIDCYSLILRTGVSSLQGYEDFIASFVDKKKWDFFNIRLYADGSLAQDIFCFDIAKNRDLQDVKITSETLNNNAESIDFFTFFTIISGFKPEHFSDKCNLLLLKNCNLRAPCMNFSYYQGPFPASPFIQNSEIDKAFRGNWNFVSSLKSGKFEERFDDLNLLAGMILFDVSYENCVPNIGFFRHVNFSSFGYNNTYSLCDSNPNPFVAIERIFQKNNDNKSLFSYLNDFNFECDYAFLLNKYLFDSWFISTKTSGKDFLNKRFCVINNNDAILAKNLLISGPFNVNSDSCEAWIAALGGNNDGANINFYRCANDDLKITIAKSKFKIFIENLIRNAKTCNVFTTISEFINRQVPADNGSISEFSREGIVQNAIKTSKLNIGSKLIVSNKNVVWFDDVSASGFLNDGAPDYLMQADIIAPISHFIVARGDTFVIRAYGDNYDKNIKKCTSRAICEVVAQRVPEFFDAKSNLPDDLFEALTKNNKTFGRRFKIMSFRWIE